MPATRFYLPGAGSAPGPTPAQWSGWTQVFAARRPMSRVKSNSPLVANNQTNSVIALNNIIGTRQYIADTPLLPQTLAGTMSLIVRGYEGVADAQSALQAVLRTVDPTTFAEKAILYGGQSAAFNTTAGALGQEFASGASTAAQTRLMTVTLTPASVAAGDLLVLEIGTRTNQSTTNARTIGLWFGDPSATADFGYTAGQTAALCPWMELSQDIYTPIASFMPVIGA